MASASKKPKTQSTQAGGDWKVAVTSDGIDQEDWARAGWAADEVVQRAREYLRRPKADPHAAPISNDVLFAQHVKVQLAYLNARRTVNLQHAATLDVGASVSGDLDVNVGNQGSLAFDVDVKTTGELEVELSTSGDEPFPVRRVEE